jgi:hypothetical protein
MVMTMMMMVVVVVMVMMIMPNRMVSHVQDLSRSGH